jgi:GT2 family glycosyltransferase
MLRQTLQALVRLAPRLVRSVWEGLPSAIRVRLGPLVHPIAAGNRRGNLELVVEPPTRRAPIALVLGPLARAEPAKSTLPYEHVVARANTPADIQGLVTEQHIFDAVIVGADAALRERAGAWGWRASADFVELPASFPSVTIVIPTWQNARLCGYCLASIARNTAWPSFEVVIVDNGSRDGTAELIARIVQHDTRFRFERNDRNLGFARAVNRGIKSSSAKYVVLLNDDVVVGPGWLSRLVASLERDPKLGLVGAVTNQIANRARIDARYDSLAGMERLARQRAVEHRAELIELDVVALFCAIARRDVLNAAGLLDERYELGMFEDDDLSRTLKRRGFRLAAAADAFVHHVGQATLGRLSDAEYLAVWESNKRRFETKWGTRWLPPAA